MSAVTDTAYALVQGAHNFGAVAVVGGPAAAWLWLRGQRVIPNVLAWLTASGWLVQALSGVGFGLTSYLSRGELPEVAGIALLALYIKVGCAIGGFALVAFYLFSPSQRREKTQRVIWPCLFVFGSSALTGAAFLRWFG